ncbi:glycosyltransferase family 39 protein [Candidatus Latescibacterota bacterium]
MLALAVVLVVAGALRLYHLDRWLPYCFEEATPVTRARGFWGPSDGSFDFDPHFYNYPALAFYLHFLTQAVVLVVGYVSGLVASVDEFRRLLVVRWPAFLLLARGVTVAMDLCAVWAASRLSRVFCNDPAGGKAGPLGVAIAALVAFNALHARLTQRVMVDIPLTFLVLLALHRLVLVLQRNTMRAYLAAGACIGLATATKYTAALLVVPLLAVSAHHLVRGTSRRTVALGTAASLATAAAIFLVCNPYCLLEAGEFIGDIRLESTHMEVGHFGHDLGTGTAAFYVAALWQATGIVGLAAIGACLSAVRQRDGAAGLLILWIFVYLTVVATWEMRADGYLLPVVAPILILGCRLLLGPALSVFRPRWRAGVLFVVFLLYLAPQAHALRGHYDRVSRPHTQVQLLKWFPSAIPAPSLIALEVYTLPPEALHAYGTVRLRLDTVDPQRHSCFYDLGLYQDFDYIIISSGAYQRYVDRAEEFPVQCRFYDELSRSWEIVRRFDPEPAVGPTILVFRNPTPERPDGPFNAERLRRLDGARAQCILQFLERLRGLLDARGLRHRAESVQGFIERVEAFEAKQQQESRRR